MIRYVTVYCSSSSAVAPVFVEAATAAGRAIAGNGWTLVYGGNPIGLMKCLADGARAAGGAVVGITPQLFVDKNYHDTLATELHVTANMRDRKALMETRGDAFLTLPGGLGTFEEIFEIMVGKQLGYHAKPIALLNTAGYFDPLLAMIDHGIEQHFIKAKVRDLYFVGETIEQVVEHFRSYRPPELADKWFRTPCPAATSEKVD
ncbi:MAG TPA: TIGR00730 family Rossman fold protein [Tepidisphaeraceae bacterium]|nr:TIGR00730 family Rossman fold protein [Tepidisphaeraceae bacterium]